MTNSELDTASITSYEPNTRCPISTDVSDGGGGGWGGGATGEGRGCLIPPGDIHRRFISAYVHAKLPTRTINCISPNPSGVSLSAVYFCRRV